MHDVFGTMCSSYVERFVIGVERPSHDIERLGTILERLTTQLEQ